MIPSIRANGILYVPEIAESRESGDFSGVHVAKAFGANSPIKQRIFMQTRKVFLSHVSSRRYFQTGHKFRLSHLNVYRKN
jgi:hypothetical protein